MSPTLLKRMENLTELIPGWGGAVSIGGAYGAADGGASGTNFTYEYESFI
jgi:hypothetical protein